MTLIKDTVDPGESTSSQSRCIPFKLTRRIFEDEAPSETIPFQRQSPPGTGILTVKLAQAINLRLPHLHEGSSSVGFADPDVCKRWLPYAVLEYEKFQVSAESICWDRRGSVHWIGYHTTIKFDVSASSELIVYLFVRNSDASMERQVVFLGSIRLNPFLESRASGMKWVDVQNGTGKVQLGVSYLEKEVLPLEDWKMWRVFKDDDTGDVVHVEKKDTDRSYAMNTIPTAEVVPGLDLGHSLCSRVEHPFIAPLKFALKSSEGLSLLSGLANGGHLFSHVQRKRRLDVDIAKFYAAELVCALEYLHDKGIILTSLKPENILLDSFGHVSLCNPGLFGLEMKDGDRIMSGTPEYPAPEILLGQETSREVDWWSLGIVLYEILTGLPPFYHKDADEQRCKIVAGSLPQLPDSISLAAGDILARLLHKDAAKRLGANGSSEVKAHAFFHDVDWHELLERKYTTPFKPISATTVFRIEPDKPNPPPVRRQSKGIIYEKMEVLEFIYWRRIERVRDKNVDSTSEKISKSEDDGWELIWEPTTQEFHFKNHLTNEKHPASLKVPGPVIETEKPLASSPTVEHNSTAQDCLGPISHSLPSQPQKKDALAVALKAGYSNHAVSRMLEHDIDLNTQVLYYDHRCDGDFRPDLLDEIPITPLEWAVEHDNLGLVNLFLEIGANANFTTYETQGPALIKAVRRRNQKLVEILSQKTSRVSMTRALCLAVDQRDTAIVNILLMNGVRCDFEEPDRPRPPNPFFHQCTLGIAPPLQEKDFIPPLVRAARHGDAGLVRLLLANGADPNTGYHVYRNQQYEGQNLVIPIQFSCGWVVQIAMEIGHLEIVQLLLDGGADVDLPQPVWRVENHTCPLVPRSMYLRVTAGLEAAVAARKSSKVAIRGSCRGQDDVNIL
ncbi:hypothetical protein V502_07584 [Pseudogymnoascus sp. VKM F-4520 (FW-2644)]|nr:hypothetical protein V502_07584 [Pseudogymnoascus sp. VKM F-4520 (FW-2644)]